MFRRTFRVGSMAMAWVHGWMLVGVGLLALTGRAQAEGNIEGVWKLVPPQAALKPADGAEIPFTSEGRQLYEEHKAAAAKGDYSFDATETRCSSPGLPREMLTPMLIRIFQRPQMVVMLFEWNRLLRQIDLAKPHQVGAPPESNFEIPTMKGKTTGQWEGDVLVAHSSGFSDAKLLDNLIPNSQDLELIEHIRLKDHNTLEDRITIQDTDDFTRPWDVVLTYRRQPDTLFPFPEDVCLERRKAGGPALPH